MKVDSVYKEIAPPKKVRKVIFQFDRNIFSSLFLPLSRFEAGEQGHWILILIQSSLSIKGADKALWSLHLYLVAVVPVGCTS